MLIYSDGSRYDGDFLNDEKNGNFIFLNFRIWCYGRFFFLKKRPIQIKINFKAIGMKGRETEKVPMNTQMEICTMENVSSVYFKIREK